MKRIIGLIAGVFFCGIVLSYGITQEIPVGKVTGKLTMKENGKPLPDAVVTLVPVGQEDDFPRLRGVESKTDGSFAFGSIPAGRYFLEISAKQHHQKRQAVWVEEGKTLAVDVVAAPNDPSLSLYASQKVFTSDETPQIELHGFIPSQEKVKIGLFRINLEEVARKGSLSKALSPLTSSRQADIDKLQNASVRVADLSHKPEKVDAEGSFIEPLKLGKQEEGIYFVICQAGGTKAVTTLNVSDLALVTKSYRGKSLVYATHLRQGTPVEGVEVMTSQAGGLVAAGKTDHDGLTEIDMKAPSGSDALVMGRKGKSVAIVGFWQGQQDSNQVIITGYCDRPAYRPGDQIQFKGIVRRAAKDGYDLPGTGTVAVKISDPDGNELSTQTLPVSSHGTFHGTFVTGKEGKPGGYKVGCTAFGQTRGIYANVVAYRKPEYSVEVKSDKPYYTMGSEASATIECKYYYGGPVVGAKVKTNIYRSPAWQYENEEGDRESYSDGGGQYSETIEAVTDASGRAKITFPTKTEGDPEVFTNDYSYSIYASVSEDEGKYFDGQGEVQVVRGDHDMTLEVQNPLVGPGESIDILVKTTDAIEHETPSPNHTVTIEIGREEWTEDASVFVPREKKEVTTGADGTAHLIIPVQKAESLSFRATSRDGKGNSIVARAFAYVEGSPAMREKEEGNLDITLDKRLYKTGDEARILIQTNATGGTALLCIQSDGILSKQLVPITSPSTLVKIPVVKEYAPNVYVSVVYVRNKKFFEAERRLRVDREDRNLKVEIKSDHDVYKPGETAQVTVRTLDSSGKPRAAEVSLGVVDEGIYAIVEDDTNLKADFYPERSNQVQTSYSFPEVYLDGGDKGSSNIPLRTTFRDTAQWNPSVWTGVNGEVTVPVVLPDNLTEWRVTAVGVSDTTEVGKNTAKFRARKDLMVRLQLPQYLVDGDRQRMTVVVANDTGSDQDVNVELGAEGLTMADGGKRVVRVPNGRPQTVEVEIVAGEPGEASVTAKAWIEGGPNDGVRQAFPINPHGRAVLEAKSGEGEASFSLPIRQTADPKFGSLKITLSPTLAGDLVTSLDGLIGFPYGCVEQTMSRFMPSVLVDKTVRDLGLPRPKKLDDLPKIVQDSLTRLERMRHSDGGFGWWEYDDSDMFMTALVLDGLDRAKQAGQNVSQVNLADTLDWAVKRLSKPEKNDRDRDRFYLAYALLRFEKKEAAKVLAKVDLSKLSPAALANIAMAYHEVGQKDRANAALDILTKSAQGGDVAFWPSEEGAWGEEASAVALVSFVTVRPSDAIIPRIVRHLRNAKRGDMWASTRDTAYSLIGLTAYLAQTKELSGETAATVFVNGKAIRTVSLNPSVLSDPDWTIEVPRSELGSGEAKIEIKKQGMGSCYFSAELRTLDTAAVLPAESTDTGLKIERKFYRLEARALENGSMKLLPSKNPVDTFKSGELVRVEITITADAPRQFVLIEEPTPSSCRVLEREDISESEEWGYWWSRTVIRDDRLAFFASELPKGISKLSYTMRAEQAGKVHSLPTSLANMYDPTKYASTSENILEVTK